MLRRVRCKDFLIGNRLGSGDCGPLEGTRGLRLTEIVGGAMKTLSGQ